MLEEALAITVELRRVLESEVERSRNERQSLKSLDSDQIFAGAAARSSFNASVADLESRLAGALARAAGRIGATEVTLERLAERARLNLLLAGRAMACVQAYLTALQPAPTAYDRRGARPGASRASTTWGKV